MRLGLVADGTGPNDAVNLAQAESIAQNAGVGSSRFILTYPLVKEIYNGAEQDVVYFSAIQAEETTYELIIEAMIPYADRGNVYSIRVVEDTETPAGVISRQPTGTIGYAKWKAYIDFTVIAGQDGDPSPLSGDYPVNIEIVKSIGGEDEEVVSTIPIVVKYEEPE